MKCNGFSMRSRFPTGPRYRWTPSRFSQLVVSVGWVQSTITGKPSILNQVRLIKCYNVEKRRQQLMHFNYIFCCMQMKENEVVGINLAFCILSPPLLGLGRLAA